MSQGSPFANQIANWQKYARAAQADMIRGLYVPSGAVALFTEGPSFEGVDKIVADLTKQLASGAYSNLTLQENGYSQQNDWGWSWGIWYIGTKPPPPFDPETSGTWSVFWVRQQPSADWLIQVHSVVPYIPSPSGS